MIACTSRADEERLLGIPFASGRNESSTPAAMVAAAKISGSRSAGAVIRLVPREPDPGRQRDDGRDAGDDTEQAESFAPPLGRQQPGGERTGGDTAQAE